MSCRQALSASCRRRSRLLSWLRKLQEQNTRDSLSKKGARSGIFTFTLSKQHTMITLCCDNIISKQTTEEKDQAKKNSQVSGHEGCAASSYIVMNEATFLIAPTFSVLGMLTIQAGVHTIPTYSKKICSTKHLAEKKNRPPCYIILYQLTNEISANCSTGRNLEMLT